MWLISASRIHLCLSSSVVLTLHEEATGLVLDTRKTGGLIGMDPVSNLRTWQIKKSGDIWLRKWAEVIVGLVTSTTHLLVVISAASEPSSPPFLSTFCSDKRFKNILISFRPLMCVLMLSCKRLCY